MKTIAISIDESSLEKLDRLSYGKGKKRSNRSEVVRLAVVEYIARLERNLSEDRERELVHRYRHRLRKEALALVRQQARL